MTTSIRGRAHVGQNLLHLLDIKRIQCRWHFFKSHTFESLHVGFSGDGETRFDGFQEESGIEEETVGFAREVMHCIINDRTRLPIFHCLLLDFTYPLDLLPDIKFYVLLVLLLHSAELEVNTLRQERFRDVILCTSCHENMYPGWELREL